MGKYDKKIWLKKNRETIIKRTSIVLSVILLVIGVIYVTYSKFSSVQEFTIINGKVVDNSDLKIISYEYDGELKNDPPAKESGYGLSDYECTNGVVADWDYDKWALVLSNLNGKVKCKLKFGHIYNISYNLNGGRAENPTIYIENSKSITLNNPIKDNYDFSGWSGTGISGTSKNVTINKGSTGNKEYTANWVDHVAPYVKRVLVSVYSTEDPEKVIALYDYASFNYRYSVVSDSSTSYSSKTKADFHEVAEKSNRIQIQFFGNVSDVEFMIEKINPSTGEVIETAFERQANGTYIFDTANMYKLHIYSLYDSNPNNDNEGIYYLDLRSKFL